jgi:type IV secretory pathway VirB10-like protein
MFSNKLAFTLVAAACITAAGGGGFLALRQNATSPAPAAVASSADSASLVSAERPVQETEAIVPPELPAVAKPTVKPATPPAAPKREERAAPSYTAARAESPAPAERSWPGNAAPAQAPAAVPTAEPPAPQPARPLETVERFGQEPSALPEAPQKSQVQYDELIVSADSVIGLQSETTISSDRARVEDRVEARVTRDVKVGNRVAIPAGARALGTVSQVEHGGKFKERGRIAIRFQTVVLADGTRLPISTDAVIREGSSPGNDTAKKMGGAAVAGTILGAIIGGGKGAAIGGMAGAGAGAGVVAAGDRSVATLHAGEPMTIRLLSPVTVVSER